MGPVPVAVKVSAEAEVTPSWARRAPAATKPNLFFIMDDSSCWVLSLSTQFASSISSNSGKWEYSIKHGGTPTTPRNSGVVLRAEALKPDRQGSVNYPFRTAFERA